MGSRAKRNSNVSECKDVNSFARCVNKHNLDVDVTFFFNTHHFWTG